MKITLDMRPTTIDVMADFMYGRIGIQDVNPVGKGATCMVGDVCIADYAIPDGTDNPLVLDDRHNRHYVDLKTIKDPADAAIIMIVDALGFEPTELLDFEFFNTFEDKAIARQLMHSVENDDLLMNTVEDDEEDE